MLNRLVILFLCVLPLAGCSATTPTVAAAVSTPPQHSENRYVMHGSPDKVALLVDSETGSVWRYEGEKLVIVPRGEIENWVRGADGKLHKQ